MSAQSVCTGQVNEFKGLIIGLQDADVPLDRDARVVADTLAKSG
jgi:hypothetical protein